MVNCIGIGGRVSVGQPIVQKVGVVYIKLDREVVFMHHHAHKPAPLGQRRSAPTSSPQNCICMLL